MTDILNLVGDIYDAGIHPEKWEGLLEKLADTFNATDATLGSVGVARVGGFVSPRTDPEYIKSYEAYYHLRNPMIRVLMAMPTNAIIANQLLPDELMDHSGFFRSEFYNEWCRPQNLNYTIGSNFFAEHDLQGSMLITGKNPMQRREFKLYNRLIPHISRAFSATQLFADAAATETGTLVGLQHLKRGAIITDGFGRIKSTNATADNILSASEALAVKDNVLTTTDPQQAGQLDRLIASCARGGIDATGGTIFLSRGNGRLPLSITGLQLPKKQFAWNIGSPATLLLISEPELEKTSQAAELRERFNMTRAEAAFALEIIKADGREAAAKRCGITLSTARTHLTRIFEKTGARRQAELVRLLMEVL